MEFLLGCNYWASNAGTEMWKKFDADVIEKDLKILSANGVKHMRIFPNWRDFQPVIPMFSSRNKISHHCLEGERESENPYYLDEEMLKRFSHFLDICKKYNLKVVVGLITGWMSGRLFVPPALYEKKLFTDPLALYFQQLFIAGFVEKFKDRDEIIAWDLGNECNCMSTAENRFEASSWTALISNAIKAKDTSRPVISGMHSLELEDSKPWRIQDQAFFTDMLTTHPYPYWCMHTRIDKTLSVRTTMHATAQTKMYAEIGKKPCMAEEIGTMGPMLSSDENAASFLRVNLFSLWANGASGVMWWCSSDQEKLESFPYSVQCVERELGLMNSKYEPKPVLKEIKKFSNFLESFAHDLPKAQTDALCILTNGQRQWGVGYMTYILAKKAGINIGFEYGDNPLPDSKLYILPSVNGISFMNKKMFDELKKRIANGADLYISLDNGIISEFEELTGMRVVDSYEAAEQFEAEIGKEKTAFSKTRNYILQSVGAKVLTYDNTQNPLLCVHSYGKGKVYLANFALENNLADTHDAFSKNYDIVYHELLGKDLGKYPILINDKNIFFTYHPGKDCDYAVLTNHSDETVKPDIQFAKDYKTEKVLYGDQNKIAPWDACVLKISKTQ
ncbi:MAG: cellulase family glycosylhydrolase [Clostridia bacterium]|nr:cellulase family glycosylhydrolase [Clostridia bacterium]